MSDPQLTLQDWETLFNMVKTDQASDKELREKIAQLEERLKQSEARIPKTGLLSHSILTRIMTVCGYLFIAQIIWFLVGGFVLNYWLIILGFLWVIFLLVIIVRWVKRTDTDYNDALQWTTRKT